MKAVGEEIINSIVLLFSKKEVFSVSQHNSRKQLYNLLTRNNYQLSNTCPQVNQYNDHFGSVMDQRRKLIVIIQTNKYIPKVLAKTLSYFYILLYLLSLSIYASYLEHMKLIIENISAKSVCGVHCLKFPQCHSFLKRFRE